MDNMQETYWFQSYSRFSFLINKNIYAKSSHVQVLEPNALLLIFHFLHVHSLLSLLINLHIKST